MHDRKLASRRGFIRLITAGAAGAVVLAACAPPSTPSPTAPPASAPTSPPAGQATSAAPTKAPATTPAASTKQVTITRFQGGDARGQVHYEKQVADYQQFNPNVKVKLEVIPGGWNDIEQKILTTIAANLPLDIINVKDVRMSDLAWRKSLKSLQQHFKQDAAEIDMNDLVEAPVKLLTYKSELYGYSFPGVWSWTMFHNDDLFKAKGLDPNVHAKTWQEMRDQAIKLTDSSKGIWGHKHYEISSREGGVMVWVLPYIWQAGGEFFNADRTKITLNTPEAKEALQLSVDLIVKDKSTLPPDIPMANTVETGKVATWWQGPWVFPTYEQNAPNLKYSCHPLPDGKKAGNITSSDCLCVPKTTVDVDAAWDHIKWTRRPENDFAQAIFSGQLPMRKSNHSKPPFSTEPRWKAFAAATVAEGVRGRPLVDGWMELNDAIAPEFEAAWYGKKSVADALAAADAKGNDVLARILSGQLGPKT